MFFVFIIDLSFFFYGTAVSFNIYVNIAKLVSYTVEHSDTIGLFFH